MLFILSLKVRLRLQLPSRSLFSFIIKQLTEQFLVVVSSWSAILFLLSLLGSYFHPALPQIAFVKTTVLSTLAPLRAQWLVLRF